MAIVQRFNVERATRPPLYLAHDADCGEMFWTSDPDRNEPYEYADEAEAQKDAAFYGGEVFQFTRLMRRTDVESFTGHNAESRLQHHYQIAAE